MDPQQKEKYIHRLFDISLLLKGAHAVIEVIGGFIVLFISQDFIIRIILSITQEELSNDPNDAFANYLIHLSQSFSLSSQHFIALYLLSHGIIKGLLVYNLFKERLWSYPVAIGVFTLFGIYQTYEYFHRGSIWLIVFTVLDIIVIWLTLHEYRYMKKTGIKPKWNGEESIQK
ncbi:MAG: DUF2127 domain-containing protein [Candidatus Pacebacteria bacterium]|nr:DUF2127 domain-containing protein [Candidatus Paceibacterota bacterium]